MAGKTHYQNFDQWTKDCAVLFGGSDAIKQIPVKYGKLFQVNKGKEVMAEFYVRSGQVPSGWIVN